MHLTATMPIFDLSNKVLLITGIGAVGEGWGNGTTMATLFARQGAVVFGCDINVQAANKAAETIRNDAQVKAHPSRSRGENIVDVMQEPIVSHYGNFKAFSVFEANFSCRTSPNRLHARNSSPLV